MLLLCLFSFPPASFPSISTGSPWVISNVGKLKKKKRNEVRTYIHNHTHTHKHVTNDIHPYKHVMTMTFDIYSTSLSLSLSRSLLMYLFYVYMLIFYNRARTKSRRRSVHGSMVEWIRREESSPLYTFIPLILSLVSCTSIYQHTYIQNVDECKKKL